MDDLDMTESLAPKSDQLDAVDLIGGPRTFTIEKVTKNNAEQPFNFHLAEFPRVWRPGKSMRRVIAAAWGGKTSKYIGQRVTLYCDNSVEFGGAAVGGSRISHMTGIGDKPLKVPLLIKKGRSAIFTVQPLKEAAVVPVPEPTTHTWEELADAAHGDPATLRNLWTQAQTQGAPIETLDYIKGKASA